MKEIPIVNSTKVALVDDEDFEKVSKYIWKLAVKRKSTDSDHVRTNLPGKNRVLRMHRIIMNLKNSDARQVDHKNLNGLDNRKENLRIATESQNNYNKQLSSKNTSGYKGVSWHSPLKRWKVTIAKNRKKIHLGYFKNKKKAAEVYDKAAIRLFGEFAWTNFREGAHWIDGNKLPMTLELF